MSVLEAFVHDPLVEWEDEKRKRVRIPLDIPHTFQYSLHLCYPSSQERAVRAQKSNGQSKRGNPVQEARVPQLKELAQNSLLPISRKLMGLHRPKSDPPMGDKEITTSNQVEALIAEATSPQNLVC